MHHKERRPFASDGNGACHENATHFATLHQINLELCVKDIEKWFIMQRRRSTMNTNTNCEVQAQNPTWKNLPHSLSEYGIIFDLVLQLHNARNINFYVSIKISPKRFPVQFFPTSDHITKQMCIIRSLFSYRWNIRMDHKCIWN
jgi:hypothetical protein